MAHGNDKMTETSPATGLLLTGGGARAAYQVGVLEAIADIRRAAGPAATGTGNPFDVITGTSAGAINAAALACGADDFDQVVANIAEVWSRFRAEQVYRADSLSVIGSGTRWRMLLGFGRFAANWMRIKPKSLLDNAPLAELLQRMVPLERLPQLMKDGHLQALAVTASSYSSGEHVTFFEAAVPMEPWVRSQRLSVRDSITHAHLLASSAIPFVFPATALPMQGHTEYFGDGSMRQSAPIAAAIHLGAQRIVVIGAGRMHEPRDTTAPNTHSGYPTMAQIAGRLITSAADGSARYDLGPGDLPAWSPDSRRLAYAGASAGKEFTARDIHIVDWQGAGPRLRVTNADDEQYFTAPTWSPDGTQIAFVEIDSGQIFVADAPAP